MSLSIQMIFSKQNFSLFDFYFSGIFCTNLKLTNIWMITINELYLRQTVVRACFSLLYTTIKEKMSEWITERNLKENYFIIFLSDRIKILRQKEEKLQLPSLANICIAECLIQMQKTDKMFLRKINYYITQMSVTLPLFVKKLY